jgi:hypothetical protein
MPYHFDVLNFHVLSEPALIEHIEARWESAI